MSHVLVGFSHDPKDWISRIIAWLSFGKSHVVQISPDLQWFIEASGKKLRGHDTGVRMRPIAEFLDQPNAVIKQIAHPDPQACWRIAKTQLGKGYDWGWIRGWLFRNPHWQHPDRWSCTEFFAWCFDSSGGKLFAGKDYLWHVTPRMIDLVAEDI